MRRGICITGALIAIAGCGSKTVDTASIESGIKSQVTAAGAAVTKVDCPSDVKSETGTTFQCSASFENGGTAKVKVTQTGKNKFEYGLVPGSLQVPGSVFEAKIKQDLEQKGAPNAKVNCPDNVIVKVGTYVVCDVSSASGQKVGTVKFTFSDSSGTVDDSSVSTSS
jgi:Domain of unknown function (DUF4333)